MKRFLQLNRRLHTCIRHRAGRRTSSKHKITCCLCSSVPHFALFLLWGAASVLSTFKERLHYAATDGEGGDENLGDEEQGGDSGKSKKKSGSDKKPDKDSERGMLKSPGNRKQMRSRAHTPSDGHQQNSYTPQQYQQNSYTPQQYQPRQDGFADESPVDGHQPYTMGAGDLTRFPSINMDWQTLRTPPR